MERDEAEKIVYSSFIWHMSGPVWTRTWFARWGRRVAWPLRVPGRGAIAEGAWPGRCRCWGAWLGLQRRGSIASGMGSGRHHEGVVGLGHCLTRGRGIELGRCSPPLRARSWDFVPSAQAGVKAQGDGDTVLGSWKQLRFNDKVICETVS